MIEQHGLLFSSTVVKKRKLRWFSCFSRSSGFAKAILQDTVNRKEGVVDRRRGGKTMIKNRHGCALPADLGKLKQDTKGVVAKSSVVSQRPCEVMG